MHAPREGRHWIPDRQLRGGTQKLSVGDATDFNHPLAKQKVMRDEHN